MPYKSVDTAEDLKSQLEHARAIADQLALPMVAVYIDYAIEIIDASGKPYETTGID